MASQKMINNLTAIIVDDELHGRENLKKIIETYCPEIELVGLADSTLKAKELVKAFSLDIVFLDINMPVLDGFDFLAEYESRDFMVVIVSAHEEYGINAVKAGAADYLLKPINIKELKQTVNKLVSKRNQEHRVDMIEKNDKIVLPTSHGFNVLVFDDIIRLEAEGSYTKVIIKEGKNKIVSRTLKDFEDTLPRDKFFRIHKSHLINLKYIKDYSKKDGNYVLMSDGHRIEIARRKVSDFVKKIKNSLITV